MDNEKPAFPRLDIADIAAMLSEDFLALVGVTREEAARRIAANLAGPPPTTSQLREVAAIFGLTVRDLSPEDEPSPADEEDPGVRQDEEGQP